MGDNIMDEPYKILGVAENASEDEIKKAYRTLVKKYHPDLHPDDTDAASKMQEINAAYDMIKSGKDSAGRPVDMNEPEYTAYSSSFGFYGGSAEADEDALEIAELLIGSGQYFYAKQILAGIRYRDGKWFFLSAAADYLTGNFTAAAAEIDRAVRLDPGNDAYRQLKDTIASVNYNSTVQSENSGCAVSVMRLGFKICIFIFIVQLLFMSFDFFTFFRSPFWR